MLGYVKKNEIRAARIIECSKVSLTAAPSEDFTSKIIKKKRLTLFQEKTLK